MSQAGWDLGRSRGSGLILAGGVIVSLSLIGEPGFTPTLTPSALARFTPFWSFLYYLHFWASKCLIYPYFRSIKLCLKDLYSFWECLGWLKWLRKELNFLSSMINSNQALSKIWFSVIKEGFRLLLCYHQKTACCSINHLCSLRLYLQKIYDVSIIVVLIRFLVLLTALIAQ